MKLHHLGASYNATPTNVETIETRTELRFLGHRYRMRTAKKSPSNLSDESLTYRGIRYKA